jgi:hypothetical protein
MSKTFWTVVISFWVACIIAGSACYAYIVHGEKEERKQFIAQYDYEAGTDEPEPEIVPLLTDYPIHTYSKKEFLKAIDETYAKLEQGFALYQQQVKANKPDQARTIALDFYEIAEKATPTFGHNEFPDATEREELYFKNLAYHLHFYAKYSSLYFIIGAKKMNQSNETLQSQHTESYTSMKSAKESFRTIYNGYKKEFNRQ